MFSRIFQHEHDHTTGLNFTDNVSKFKLKRAYDKAEKMMNIMKKDKNARIIKKT